MLNIAQITIHLSDIQMATYSKTMLALAKANGVLEDLYEQRVNTLIREKYNVNQELAIQRQRDTKPEQFEEYNTFCDQCKAQAKGEVYPE